MKANGSFEERTVGTQSRRQAAKDGSCLMARATSNQTQTSGYRPGNLLKVTFYFGMKNTKFLN
jgi:hypothetical protein